MIACFLRCGMVRKSPGTALGMHPDVSPGIMAKCEPVKQELKPLAIKGWLSVMATTLQAATRKNTLHHGPTKWHTCALAE